MVWDIMTTKDLLNLFLDYPKENVKPPVDILQVEEDGIKKIVLQLALAGFEEKDIEVKIVSKKLPYNYLTANNLIIKGSNVKKNIAPKFKCTFEKTWTIGSEISCDKIEKVFENGLLSIKFPYKGSEISERII